MKLARPDQPSLPLEMSTSPAPSFAEGLELIRTWTDLTETRRANLSSGLRSAAKLAGLPMSEMPCCTKRLNGLLFERPPAASGMSGRRLRDVLALVRAVLRRLGRHRPFEAGEQDLSGEWAAFMGALPDTPRRAGLRGLARWCSAQGMSPHQVEDQALARYVEDDRATRLAASARDQGRSLVAAWSWATALQPAPEHYAKVTLPSRREPYTLAFDRYPGSFQASVDRFTERLSGGGHSRVGLAGAPGGRFQAAIVNPFRGPAKSFRPLKPATIASRLFSIRQAAAALHLTGRALEEIRDLRDLVHPLEHAGRILDFYDERAGGKSGGQLRSVAETLRQIGHFHVEISEEDRAQLSAWAKAAQGRRRGEMGPKARACIQQFVDPRNRARLLHLPEQLAREAKESGVDPSGAARAQRAAHRLHDHLPGSHLGCAGPQGRRALRLPGRGPPHAQSPPRAGREFQDERADLLALGHIHAQASRRVARAPSGGAGAIGRRWRHRRRPISSRGKAAAPCRSARCGHPSRR